MILLYLTFVGIVNILFLNKILRYFLIAGIVYCIVVCYNYYITITRTVERRGML